MTGINPVRSFCQYVGRPSQSALSKLFSVMPAPSVSVSRDKSPITRALVTAPSVPGLRLVGDSNLQRLALGTEGTAVGILVQTLSAEMLQSLFACSPFAWSAVAHSLGRHWLWPCWEFPSPWTCWVQVTSSKPYSFLVFRLLYLCPSDTAYCTFSLLGQEAILLVVTPLFN